GGSSQRAQARLGLAPPGGGRGRPVRDSRAGRGRRTRWGRRRRLRARRARRPPGGARRRPPRREPAGWGDSARRVVAAPGRCAVRAPPPRELAVALGGGGSVVAASSGPVPLGARSLTTTSYGTSSPGLAVPASLTGSA